MIENFYILTHPDNLVSLRSTLNKDTYYVKSAYNLFDGIEIITNNFMDQYTKKWQFPEHKFVEYEEKDKEWAVPIGHGKWVADTTKPLFLKVERSSYRNFLKYPQTIILGNI
jgi:hypothetical protein